MPCAFSCVTRTLPPLEATLPAGHTVFRYPRTLLIEKALINYFWKLLPDIQIKANVKCRLDSQKLMDAVVHQVPNAVDVATRVLPPLETTLSAGHAILRYPHPSISIRAAPYKLFLEVISRYNVARLIFDFNSAQWS